MSNIEGVSFEEPGRQSVELNKMITPEEKSALLEEMWTRREKIQMEIMAKAVYNADDRRKAAVIWAEHNGSNFNTLWEEKQKQWLVNKETLLEYEKVKMEPIPLLEELEEKLKDMAKDKPTGTIH